jgi:hypothetical protein
VRNREGLVVLVFVSENPYRGMADQVYMGGIYEDGYFIETVIFFSI